MIKKKCTVTIKGKDKIWSFEIWAQDSWIKDWREDGLEINEVIYSIPEWVVKLRLIKVWMRCSDIFNFRNPFK